MPENHFPLALRPADRTTVPDVSTQLPVFPFTLVLNLIAELPDQLLNLLFGTAILTSKAVEVAQKFGVSGFFRASARARTEAL